MTVAIVLVVVAGGLCSCRSLGDRPAAISAPPRVRFLLTFDDGPSIRTSRNPTLAIADQLRTNDVQPGIRAVFFVQVLYPRGGGAPEGRTIIRGLSEQGQEIGIHSTSLRGHISHTTLDATQLAAELRNAKNIIQTLVGSEPRLIRPPYGDYGPITQDLYAGLNLDLLMDDIRARDGVIHGYNASVMRRLHFRLALRAIRKQLVGQALGGAPFPVIVSFHDVNPYTARHMTEYLHILVEEARRVGLELPDQPFYGTHEEVMAATHMRRVPPPIAP